jgi:uncharacterized protein
MVLEHGYSSGLQLAQSRSEFPVRLTKGASLRVCLGHRSSATLTHPSTADSAFAEPRASSWRAKLAQIRVMHMRWEDLAFLHWPIDAAILQSRLPDRLRLDTFEGQAWIGITPFRMTQVRPAWLPSMPGISTFPELNVRTYVVADGIPGIWFVSLDAMQILAVHAARSLLNLPYHYARASIETHGDHVQWQSHRGRSSTRAGRFFAHYRPTGGVYLSVPGDLDHWLTERYYLYTADHRERVFRQAVRHRQWPLQAANAEVFENTMWAANRLPDMAGPPLAHFSRQVDVWACTPEPVDKTP